TRGGLGPGGSLGGLDSGPGWGGSGVSGLMSLATIHPHGVGRCNTVPEEGPQVPASPEISRFDWASVPGHASPALWPWCAPMDLCRFSTIPLGSSKGGTHIHLTGPVPVILLLEETQLTTSTGDDMDRTTSGRFVRNLALSLSGGALLTLLGATAAHADS